jgi:hypothetical protein
MEARIWSADLTHRERFGRGLMILNKVFDGLLELLDRVMIASLDLLFTELGKRALDLIDPRTVGWGKVQVVARPVWPASYARARSCGWRSYPGQYGSLGL